MVLGSEKLPPFVALSATVTFVDEKTTLARARTYCMPARSRNWKVPDAVVDILIKLPSQTPALIQLVPSEETSNKTDDVPELYTSTALAPERPTIDSCTVWLAPLSVPDAVRSGTSRASYLSAPSVDRTIVSDWTVLPPTVFWIVRIFFVGAAAS